MTPRLKMIYDSGMKNKAYIKDLWDADEDKPPVWYADNDDKVFFATVYYGWLVGKYGAKWESHL